MKAKHNNLFSLLIGRVGVGLLVLGALLLSSCSKKDNAFDLEGECKLLSLTLDEHYQAVIDGTKRTALVAIPENYDEQDMSITSLSLSEGATANVAVGSHLNLAVPQMIRVTNGSVFLEYTLSVKHDEARILSFVINGQYIGVINQTNRTISVQVPEGTNLTSLVPTVTATEGATVTPASGTPCDFTNPVDFTVTYNTASYTYTATVTEMTPPHMIYVGLAATMQQLNMEEQTACSWMLNNVEKSAYVSFADLKQLLGRVGAFFLTRYATYLPAYIGEADCVPNNCWGQNEADAETVGGPWEFSIAGHTGHALWQNLLMKSDALDHVYTCDAGYRITNSTAQYHIGADWGGYETRDVFRSKTGAVDIAGGNDAVVAWEYPATAEHGGIICIGSGCYDWYSVAGEAGTGYYHANIAKITENAINYLTGK